VPTALALRAEAPPVAGEPELVEPKDKYYNVEVPGEAAADVATPEGPAAHALEESTEQPVEASDIDIQADVEASATPDHESEQTNA